MKRGFSAGCCMNDGKGSLLIPAKNRLKILLAMYVCTVRADTAGAITDPQPYGIVHTMYTVRMHSISGRCAHFSS